MEIIWKKAIIWGTEEVIQQTMYFIFRSNFSFTRRQIENERESLFSPSPLPLFRSSHPPPSSFPPDLHRAIISSHFLLNLLSITRPNGIVATPGAGGSSKDYTSRAGFQKCQVYFLITSPFTLAFVADIIPSGNFFYVLFCAIFPLFQIPFNFQVISACMLENLGVEEYVGTKENH